MTHPPLTGPDVDLPIGGPDHPPPDVRLRALLRLERQDLQAVLVFAVAVGLLTLIAPFAVQVLINTVVFTSMMQPIIVLAVLVLAFLGVATLLRVLQILTVEQLQRRLFVRAALSISRRLPRARPDAWDEHHAPELVNRFFDVATVQKAASSILLDAVTAVLQTVVGVVILALYHPWLLAYDVLLIALLFIVFRALAQGASSTAIKESKHKYRMVEWLEVVASRLDIFKRPEADRWRHARTVERVEDYLQARQAHFRIVLRQRVAVQVLQVIALAILLALGGWLVINRQLSVGQFVAAELIVASLLSGLVKLSDKLETFYDLLAGLDKLGHLADLPEQPSGGLPLPGEDGPLALTFEGVHAAAGGNRSRLRGLSLRLEPGELLALRGPTGSGKRLVADLVYGLVTPTEGKVRVGGRDVRTVAPEALRGGVVLLRTPEVLPATVAENLVVARADVSWTEIEQALRVVSLDLEQLPQGAKTCLRADGAPLTREEILRLVLARSLVERPRLLVIDEALDVLEVDVATALVEAVRRASPATVLLLTGRRALADACPRSVCLTDLVPAEAS